MFGTPLLRLMTIRERWVDLMFRSDSGVPHAQTEHILITLTLRRSTGFHTHYTLTIRGQEADPGSGRPALTLL